MALYTSILTGGTNNHTTTSEEANSLATDFISNGIIGAIGNTNSVAPMTGGFAVNAQGTPDMTVAVTAGAAYVAGTPSGQGSQEFRVRLSANENVTISANSSGSTKYDWVYIKIDPTAAANPNLAGDDVSSLVVSRSTSNSADNGTPPTYGYLIAVVTVANGASSITNGNIRDVRVRSEITANSSAVSTGWVTGTLPAISTVAANEMGNYTITHASTIAGEVSPGMKRRFTRATAAPTTCFNLDGSNDYLNKTSPSGMTGTNNYSFAAWVRPTATKVGIIESKHSSSGTSNGWIFHMNANRQIVLQGLNANNFRTWTTFLTLPLDRWTHVTARLDMTSTATSGVISFNGKDVAVAYTTTGSPTTWVNAGNYEIGSNNGGTNLFPGQLAQVAVFSALITQSTLMGYRHSGYTGSEPSLISAYSGANTTDLATTGNNLTAQNGAVSGYASSPFGNFGASSTLDYAQTMTVSSDGLTETVQVPDGCTLPTGSSPFTTSAYSTQQTPFGFPQKNALLSSVTHSIPNIAAATLTNTSQDLASSGLYVPIYAPIAMEVDVSFSIGVGSTTDFEFWPEIRLDGVAYAMMQYVAAPGLGSARSTVRTIHMKVPLTAGYHNISGGVTLSSAIGPVWGAANGARLTVTIPMGILA